MIDNDTDVLISRILDRQAEPADFDAFAATAGNDPGAWVGLLGALRDDAALGAATAERLALADAVEAPALERRAVRVWPAWSGWAAALLLALAWLGQGGPDIGDGSRSGAAPLTASGPITAPAAGSAGGAGTPTGAPTGPVRAGLFDADGPRLREGVVPAADRVLGELPPELVSTRAALDGPGLDVVYVRRVLERTRVDSAWSYATDEMGNPAPVPVNLDLLTESDLH
jgi:hypothetical protein